MSYITILYTILTTYLLYILYTYSIYIATFQYTTVQAVLSDMALMCRNAEQYNGPTSPIVAEAKALYTSLGRCIYTIHYYYILYCTIIYTYAV